MQLLVRNSYHGEVKLIVPSPAFIFKMETWEIQLTQFFHIYTIEFPQHMHYFAFV